MFKERNIKPWRKPVVKTNYFQELLLLIINEVGIHVQNLVSEQSI